MSGRKPEHRPLTLHSNGKIKLLNKINDNHNSCLLRRVNLMHDNGSAVKHDLSVHNIVGLYIAVLTLSRPRPAG